MFLKVSVCLKLTSLQSFLSSMDAFVLRLLKLKLAYGLKLTVSYLFNLHILIGMEILRS